VLFVVFRLLVLVLGFVLLRHLTELPERVYYLLAYYRLAYYRLPMLRLLMLRLLMLRLRLTY
jgi:hypothetical protein